VTSGRREALGHPPFIWLPNHNRETHLNVGFSYWMKWSNENGLLKQECSGPQLSFESKTMSQLLKLAEFGHWCLQGGSIGIRPVTKIGTM
jgi:hypothetical protein